MTHHGNRTHDLDNTAYNCTIRHLYQLRYRDNPKNIYQISLVFSEFGRFSLANRIDTRHKEELKYIMYCFNRYLYQCYSNNFWGVVSIAQLVEVTDSAVLGGVVEVVSSIPVVGHKILSAFPA